MPVTGIVGTLNFHSNYRILRNMVEEALNKSSEEILKCEEVEMFSKLSQNTKQLIKKKPSAVKKGVAITR